MPNIARQLSQEFFQLNGFFTGGSHPFFVLNPSSEENPIRKKLSNGAGETPPFLLKRENIGSISGAAVFVRAWHTEQIFPSVIINKPDIYSFEGLSMKEARSFFSKKNFKKILVLSRFPKKKDIREKSAALLLKKGINHAIEFETILAYLANYVQANINYAESDTLQLIRLLKCYGLLRGPQLELFR